MPMKRMIQVFFLLAGLAVAGLLVYQIPAVEQRLAWRLDAGRAYLRGWVFSVADAPTPLPNNPGGAVSGQPAAPAPGLPTLASPTPTPTPLPSPTLPPQQASPTVTPTNVPTPTPTVLPPSVQLPAPAWEKQDWNNCGPASLSLHLKMFGWTGDQYTISSLLKPDREDRNVNVEELVFWVRNYAGWLNAQYRVGGDLDTLKRFLANGIPVMVEKGYLLDVDYWPNDDRWSGHYLVLTGYDDAAGVFTAQDTYVGANQLVPYETLEAGWKAFNYVYIFLFLPTQEETVKTILGAHWDPELNRLFSLERTAQAVETAPEDAFAWFNYGSNLVYFARYAEAGVAYDTARSLGLPQRMFRYQFGPFMAYFHAGRNEELMALTEYALKVTDVSEEARLWRGWGFYRQGDNAAALEQFNLALEVQPTYQDAIYAINFILGK